MSSIESKLAEVLEQGKRDLIAMHIELGMKASGKWVESLDVVIGNFRGYITGEDYSEQLEEGRNSGKYPPWNPVTKTFDEIEEWIKDKGLSFDIPIKSFAFLIARNMAENGWNRSKHGGVNLVSKVFTPEYIQRMIDKMGGSITLEFANIIGKQFK